MSTIIMSACWPLQGMTPAQKMVLISLADQANDDGVCWPAVGTIATRACLSKRAVQDALLWLEAVGALRREFRHNKSTSYVVTPGSLDLSKAPTSRKRARGADGAPPAAGAPHANGAGDADGAGGENGAPHAAGAGGGADGAPPGVQQAHPNRKGTYKEPNPPLPPGPGGESPDLNSSRKQRRTFKSFVQTCMQSGEKPISTYQPLLDYVEASGLPMEFVNLAWETFKAEHLPSGANERRQQADWRRHFLNYVTKGYYRLWYAEGNGGATPTYRLTTQGLQAQAAVENRLRKAA